MIRINKTANPPARLTDHGATQTATDIAEYLADPALYTNQVRRQPKKTFLRRIYGCITVKDQLKVDQHHKCCYCESKFTANSPGDVEHYRPKARIKIPGNRGFQKPGYYWLVYEWENLFFSCEKCNRTNKGDKFPLLNETKRATPHDNPNTIGDESPLLICPTENPSNHIEFDKDTIKGKDIRGEKSIEYYGLKRPELLDKRRAKFQSLLNSQRISRNPNTVTQQVVDSYNAAFATNYTIQDIKDIVTIENNELSYAISDEGEFSLMARTNFTAP